MATTPAVVRFAYIDYRVENHDKGDKPAKQQVGESIEEEKQDKRVKWSARCRYCSKVITETRGTTWFSAIYPLWTQ